VEEAGLAARQGTGEPGPGEQAKDTRLK